MAGALLGLPVSARAHPANALEGAVSKGQLRRVVTAHDGEGRSYIAHDEVVATSDLWSASTGYPLGEVGGGERAPGFTPTGASRLFVASIGPSPDPKPSLENRIGFHRTPGLAYCVVLNGEIVFLVDRQEVRLTAGDVVVERGTDHSWRNEGDESVGLLVVTMTMDRA